MSFLEMLDVLNEKLVESRARSRSRSSTTAARESAARAAIVINGTSSRPDGDGTTVCQLHMRFFKDGDDGSSRRAVARETRSPSLKDLVVDRSALDKIMARRAATSR